MNLVSSCSSFSLLSIIAYPIGGSIEKLSKYWPINFNVRNNKKRNVYAYICKIDEYFFVIHKVLEKKINTRLTNLELKNKII